MQFDLTEAPGFSPPQYFFSTLLMFNSYLLDIYDVEIQDTEHYVHLMNLFNVIVHIFFLSLWPQSLIHSCFHRIFYIWPVSPLSVDSMVHNQEVPQSHIVDDQYCTHGHNNLFTVFKKASSMIDMVVVKGCRICVKHVCILSKWGPGIKWFPELQVK